MSTWRWLVIRSTATLGAALSIALPLQAAPEPTRLLALRVNGVDAETEVEVLPLVDGLALPTDAWRMLGLTPSMGVVATLDGRDFHRLEGNRLTWQIDAPSQTLMLQAPASAFAGSTLALVGPASSPAVGAGIGGFLNYDVLAQDGSSGRAAQALLEIGGFGATGAARQTVLARRQAGAVSVRLESTLSFERPGSGATLRLGDGITEPGTWGRAQRFGGLQWSTDFALRPDLQTLAAPVLRGETSLPSTVDVLIDGGRRVQGRVGAGPFTLTDLPVVTGQGEVKLVVRDLMGREQVTVLPYYASPSLLRPGLAAQSFEAGRLREEFGLVSNRYGRAFISATDRRGLEDGFTRELRAEAAAGEVTAGLGIAWPLPAAFGVAQVRLVGSQRGSEDGLQIGAAAEHKASSWSGSLQWRRSTQSFVQLGQPGDTTPRTEFALAFGSNWRGAGIGGGIVHRSDWQGRKLRLWSANVSRQLGGSGSLGLFVVRDMLARRQVAQLVWSVALDARQSLSLAAARDGASTQGGQRQSMQWQRSASGDDGATLRLLADRGALKRDEASANWETRAAALSAALVQSAHGSDLRVGAAGALAWLGDSMFVGRRIDDSFAVVQVADYAGIPVLLEHRPVAVTDARGRAFVAGLRGREVNRLGIDPGDLPFDAELSSTERLVVPPARSGVIIAMPLQRTRAARFRLVNAEGASLPAGGRLFVEGRSFPIGFDGLGYATGLQARQIVQVRWPGHACETKLVLPAGDEMLPDLGTLVCQ